MADVHTDAQSHGLAQGGTAGGRKRRPQSLRERGEADSSYQEALRFAQSLPTDKYAGEAEWIAKHAEREYERASEVWVFLEEKAHRIVNYPGAFSGFAAVAFAYEAANHSAILGLSIRPVLALSISAARAAVRVQSPADTPVPPAVKDAFVCAGKYQRSGQAAFAAWVGVASAALWVITNEKSGLVETAVRRFVWALMMLPVPVLVALCLREWPRIISISAALVKLLRLS
jgi:hypothetical protein